MAQIYYGELMKSFVAFLSMIFSLNTMAMNFSLELSKNQKFVLNKISKSVYKQSYAEEISKIIFHLTDDEEEEYSLDQDIPPKINNSENIQIFLMKKNKKLRFVDLSENINQIIPAKIKKKFGGRIASIKMAKDKMRNFYSKSLEADAYRFLNELDLKEDNLTTTISFVFSDFTCEKDPEGLVCDLDMSVHLTAHN